VTRMQQAPRVASSRLALLVACLAAACTLADRGDEAHTARESDEGFDGSTARDAPAQGLQPDSSGSYWREGPRLPQPIGNNALAAVAGPDGVTVLSFLGIDSTKSWSGVTNSAYRWDMGSGHGWRPIGPVPGPGRLAATAQPLAGRVFVFGGYTVAEDGAERSLPDVAVYTPRTDSWGSAADIPVPVDDAVSGVWASTSIYLVSGWHQDRNVAHVQVFDPSIDRWSVATPIPGAPVFGHAGAVVGGDIVYVGGAKVVEGRPRFVVDSAAWRGHIDPLEPSAIHWEPMPRPPGAPLYRAGAVAASGFLILVGGSDNPYNYDGVGYDGAPSAPVGRALAWRAEEGWSELPSPPVATMDHRTLAFARGTVFVVGGMTESQRVTDRVFYADLQELLAARRPVGDPEG